MRRILRPLHLLLMLAVILALASAAALGTTPTPRSNVGTKQAAVHKAAVRTAPLVPFIRTLHVGTSGPTVFQLQRALKAAGVRPKASHATGYFGKLTAHQVAAFQKRVHIRPVTGRYGTKTHHALSKFYDKAGRSRLTQVVTSRRYVAITNAIVTVAAHARQVGGETLTYSQSASRNNLPKYPGVPPATDCSGYVTWVYQSVGLPDPSGWGFHPVGWTGSLSLHGTVVSATHPHLGDLAYYGGGPPFGHVAIVVHLHPTLVSSHGSTGIHVVSITYRPLSQLRRYF